METVHDLKIALSDSIMTLKEACPSPVNLTLMIDGFELLNQSGLDVIKRGGSCHVGISLNTRFLELSFSMAFLLFEASMSITLPRVSTILRRITMVCS